MIGRIKNRITYNKKIRYLNIKELEKLNKKINTRKEKYTEKNQDLKEKYVKLANRKKETGKGNINKIIKTSKKIQRTEMKIHRCQLELELVDKEKYIKRSAIYKFKKWFSRIPYVKQKWVFGIIFMTPWVLGFLLFFLPAIIKSLWWSLNDVEPVKTEIVSKFVGFSNFIELYNKYLIDGNRIFKLELLFFAKDLAINLPIILIFSLFIAVLLNTKFKGHQFVKVVFFIPVIYNINIISDTLSKGFGVRFENSVTSNVLLTTQLTDFLMQIGIGLSFFDIVLSAVDRIFMIVNFSGIQILIFVAALQSIPNQLYEAARVEGATKYETFWKITLPMVTPMLLTAAIYTVVDSFSRAPIYRFLEYATVQSRYGLASAIAMSYFVINLVIILVVLGLLKGLVFYYDER